MGFETDADEGTPDPRWDLGTPRFGSPRHLACLGLAMAAIVAVVAWTLATLAASGTALLRWGWVAACVVAMTGTAVGLGFAWASGKGVERVYFARSRHARPGPTS